MQALVARVRQLDVGTFETAPPDVLTKDLAPRTNSLLAQANEIVRDVLHACDDVDSAAAVGPGGDTTLPPPVDDFELAIDSAVRSGTFDTTRIADIAFMAQVELRQRARRLASIAPDANALVAECDSALRRVTKALCAIDRAIARASDAPPFLDYMSELEISLRVRKTYASFRRAVLGSADVTPATLEEAERTLRHAGAAIAVVVGQPVYPALRLNDRMQLRSLQQRILSWLKTPSRDVASGLHIWGDVIAFAAILKHVDRRQELFEHDARVVWNALDSYERHGRLDGDQLVSLRALAGRDDEADRLLEGDVRDAEAWAPVLERIASEIGTRTVSMRP